jgi:hypothetical protein
MRYDWRMRKTLFSLAFLLVSFDYTTTWYQIYPDEIQKPFIYRQLIPTLTSLLPLGEVMSLVVIEILICIATGLLMLYAYEKMWKVSGANDVLLLFCFYLVVTVLNFSFPWKKSYDAPTAFFFLLMFILWREKKYALSIPVFALACLNRETAILIVPVLFLMRRRWALHIYQVVIFIGIRYILVQVFSDYDGTAVWIRPIENFLMHMEQGEKMKRIAILTGGGDAPGLNAVIRAAVKTAIREYGCEVIGVRDGYDGFIDEKGIMPLGLKDVRGILPRGGTILGTANRGNPFARKIIRDGKEVTVDVSDEIVKGIERLELDALLVLGGDGTLHIAHELAQKGVPVIGVPKTIDNDIGGTDITFGFDTALTIATEAIDRLHTTAEAHHRVMVLELMGRDAGFIALHSGVAGGADVILIPEIPSNMNRLWQSSPARHTGELFQHHGGFRRSKAGGRRKGLRTQRG